MLPPIIEKTDAFAPCVAESLSFSAAQPCPRFQALFPVLAWTPCRSAVSSDTNLSVAIGFLMSYLKMRVDDVVLVGSTLPWASHVSPTASPGFRRLTISSNTSRGTRCLIVHCLRRTLESGPRTRARIVLKNSKANQFFGKDSISGACRGARGPFRPGGRWATRARCLRVPLRRPVGPEKLEFENTGRTGRCVLKVGGRRV
mmetsp:Transcript_19376/g.41699  ORF Transcript_19376/g.41699 Transcript_19376/m.41699 type:complete len:201 (+) Transcript_19376:227-829(+)